MAYETEDWLYVKAKHIGVKRTVKVRLIVIHTMEAPEGDQTAENVARYFQNPDKPSSCHINVDNNTIVQSVKDSYVAFAAPGANHDGIQVELAGVAKQTVAQWRDYYSLALLALASDAAAQYCLKYSVPPTWLTDAELKTGKSGIIGHDQASRVYKLSNHTDPGPNFPKNRFIAMVAASVLERK
jgi:hypothetical protein